MKNIFLLSVLLIGCCKKDTIVTPSRDLQCPVCMRIATLKQFDEHESRYVCIDHELTVTRETGKFRQARIKTTYEKELESKR